MGDRWDVEPANHTCPVVIILTLTRDQELWGMALWVEKQHAERGAEFIATRIAHLASQGEGEGAALWREVAERYDQLCERGTVS